MSEPKTTGNSTSSTITNSPVYSGGGILVLGQEQDSMGGNFSSLESFRGRTSRFDMWSAAPFSSEVIRRRMDSCNGGAERGDVFAWADALAGLRGFLKVGENITIVKKKRVQFIVLL